MPLNNVCCVGQCVVAYRPYPELVQRFMDSCVDSSSPDALPPPFPQLLFIGRPGSTQLVAALREDGVDVIVAFDSERGARLLNQFHPHAILCAPADVDAVLAYCKPNVHVIVLGQDGWTATRTRTTVISSTLHVTDVARRVHDDIAAQRADAPAGARTNRQPPSEVLRS
jgi:hypothetical protein